VIRHLINDTDAQMLNLKSDDGRLRALGTELGTNSLSDHLQCRP